jgi:tetratricopeptide (TPR) repeat protein
MRLLSFALLLCFAGVVLASDPKEAEKPFKDGLRYEQNGQWKEAEAAYSEAIQLNSASALYYLHRARVRLSSGDAAHALEDASTASRLEPKNGDTFVILGNIDVLLKNARGAITDYTHAI